MDVNVRHVKAGVVKTLRLPPTSSIRELKQVIQDSFEDSPSVASQTLVIAGCCCEDGWILEELVISKQLTSTPSFHLVIRKVQGVQEEVQKEEEEEEEDIVLPPSTPPRTPPSTPTSFFPEGVEIDPQSLDAALAWMNSPEGNQLRNRNPQHHEHLRRLIESSPSRPSSRPPQEEEEEPQLLRRAHEQQRPEPFAYRLWKLFDWKLLLKICFAVWLFSRRGPFEKRVMLALLGAVYFVYQTGMLAELWVSLFPNREVPQEQTAQNQEEKENEEDEQTPRFNRPAPGILSRLYQAGRHGMVRDRDEEGRVRGLQEEQQLLGWKRWLLEPTVFCITFVASLLPTWHLTPVRENM